MSNISEIQNPKGFAQDFLKHYFASGFGGMQKRDLDTLVFGLLLKYGAFGGSADAPDATEISFQLGISPARVRTLLRDAQLRYLQYDEHEAKIRLVKLFETCRFERTGSHILFSVSDPLLQQYFTHWVSRVNGFHDSTFNPNLIKVSYEVLADVLLLFADQKTLAIFLDKIGKKPGKTTAPIDYKTIIIESIKSIAVDTITISIRALLGF
jgi:hypothetical protein